MRAVWPALGLIHCETPAWVSVRKLFLPAVAAINASSYAPGLREGALIAILGDSHSGKTHILRRLSWHIQLQEEAGTGGLYRPLVMVKARAPSTMKGLGEDILTELRRRGHAPVEARNLSHRTAADIWSEVRALLQAYGVSILIIDEVHNILVRDGAKDYEATAAAIKSMVIDDVWPMTVVLAGTREKTGRLIDNSEELTQRAERVVIEPIAKGDAEDIRAFVSGIEAQLDLPQRSGLAEGDRPIRFWLASNGHRGRIAKLIYRAAEKAYMNGLPRLDNALLAAVLTRRYGVIDAINPFLLVTLDNAQPIPDCVWRPEGNGDPPLNGNGRGRRR